MYDIKPLEEEWKKYRKKKRKPLYLIGIISAGVLVGLFALFGIKDLSLPELPQFISKDSSETTLEKTTNVLIEDKLTTLQIRKQVVVEDIKPVVKLKVEEDVPALPVVEDIPVLDEVKPKKYVKKEYKKPVRKNIKVEKPRKKMHLNIIESSSVSAYKDVEKRFYESHDTDDSLFLAKSYFRKGNYKKAEYWALQTNKVNKNIDDSWLIFAESKVKLGRKNEAIRVLTNYVKMSNSSRAKSLLYKLKK